MIMSRKLYYIALLSLALTVALSLALAGCTDDSTSDPIQSSTASVSDGSSSAPVEDSSAAESLPSEDTSSDEVADISSEAVESDDTYTESSSVAETSREEIPSDEEPSEDEEPSDDPVISDSTNSSEESDVSEEDGETEIPDEPDGTKENPYLAFPAEDGTVQLEAIAAKTEVYYDIYRVGGMDFVLENSNAYVIYDGVTYYPQGGVITFRVESALASAPISFCIGNDGSKESAFTITFTAPAGTFSSPCVVTQTEKTYEISLESGEEFGYYYLYEATKDGTLRFYMTATKDSSLSATNQSNSAQRSTSGDGYTDEQGREYFDLVVKKGDLVLINMGAIPNARGKYPATTITWSFEYL